MRTKSWLKTIARDHNWLGLAIPPGEILVEESVKPLRVGQLEAAKHLIVLGNSGITANTALRFARFLKTSP
jgi:plasmid maintenance system antidote protein VapI